MNTMAHAEGYPQFKPSPGRPSRLKDPAFLKLVSECFAAGMSRKAIAEECDCDKETVSRWRKDPRVKAQVTRLIEDRAIQISRKIDAVIEGRLSQAENLKIQDLITIRKEYGGSRVASKEIDDNMVNEAVNALEQNPMLAKELEDLVRRSQEQRPQESVASDG